MNKKLFAIKIFLIFILSFQLLILSGCSNTSDNSNKYLSQKVNEEIEYIDNNITNMLNKLNNISYQNYKVTTREVSLGNNSQSSNQTSSNSTSSNTSGNQTNSSSENQSSSGNSSSNNNQNITVTDMQPYGILNRDSSTIDWNSIRSMAETFSNSWNTIILDLYKLNINKDDIVAFSEELNSLLIYVKEENKTKTLTSLSHLYSYIPKYLSAYENNSKKSVKETKQYIFNAYALVEQNKWNEVGSEINKASETFLNVVNDLEFAKTKQFNVNRTYILIKELQTNLNLEDKDVFYIKYKNILEELLTL